MIQSLTIEHEWVKYPAFHNAYPLRNEVSAFFRKTGDHSSPYGNLYIDDHYGRIFDRDTHEFLAKYGETSMMPYYPTPKLFEIADELRVPYRRIPIFRADNLEKIKKALVEIQSSNSGHKILLRGQTKTYLIERSKEESAYFFGQDEVKEPSFLPSHLRKNFDPYFLKCMWQSQAAILLNDIEHDMMAAAHDVGGKAFRNSVSTFRNSPGFVLFSLGLAQHYGLPSVGLDLTDRLEVACWFATRAMSISPTGKATSRSVEIAGDVSPTIFVFRCPPDAVFAYRNAKPKGMPEGRPDRQSAWFGNVGWGASSNQLGSYLMCGFQLTPEVITQIGHEHDLESQIFPSRHEDPILQIFLNLKGTGKYEGEALRALQGIYFTDDKH